MSLRQMRAITASFREIDVLLHTVRGSEVWLSVPRIHWGAGAAFALLQSQSPVLLPILASSGVTLCQQRFKARQLCLHF